MARRQTDSGEDSGEERAADAPLEPDAPADMRQDATARLAEFFDDIQPGDQSTIDVYQVDDANRRNKSFLFSFGAGELSPTDLMQTAADRYGPGRYEASGRGPKGRILFRQEFQVGPLTRRPRPLFDGARGPSPSPPSVRDRDAILTALERLTAAQLQLAERLASPAPPGVAAVATPLTTLDLLKEFTAIKKLFSDSDAGSTFASAITMLKDVLSLRDTLVETEAPDPISAAMKILGPMLERGVEGMKQNPRLEHLRGLAPPRERGGTTSAAPAGNALDAHLREAMPHLMTAASFDADPDRVADMILERAESQGGFYARLLEQLAGWLADGEATDRIIAVWPAAGRYREWFDELGAVLLAHLAPADRPGAEVGNGGGSDLPLSEPGGTSEPDTAPQVPLGGNLSSTGSSDDAGLLPGGSALRG